MYGAIQFLKHTARLGALVALSGTALASESWLQTQVSPHIFKLNQAVSYKVEPPVSGNTAATPLSVLNYSCRTEVTQRLAANCA